MPLWCGVRLMGRRDRDEGISTRTSRFFFSPFPPNHPYDSPQLPKSNTFTRQSSCSRFVPLLSSCDTSGLFLSFFRPGSARSADPLTRRTGQSSFQTHSNQKIFFYPEFDIVRLDGSLWRVSPEQGGCGGYRIRERIEGVTMREWDRAGHVKG